MSTSSFSGSYASREHPRGASVSLPRQQTPTEILAHTTSSDWLGALGEQVRLHVHVVAVTSDGRKLVYLVRRDGSSDLVEWSTQRRYGIAVGDRLALSGLVKAHVTRDDTRVTVLRDCFNPLRMA